MSHEPNFTHSPPPSDRDKLAVVISSLIDSLHTGMEANCNPPLDAVMKLSASIDHLTAAFQRLPVTQSLTSLERRATVPPMPAGDAVRDHR